MKKVLMSILVAILLISMTTVVNAASGSINIGASSEKVKPGEAFTVTLIGTADNNITALQANISYDETKLAIDKKTVGTGFADFSGTNEIAVAVSDSNSLSKTATLYTITFKVLDAATVGETVINFKNVSLAVVNENSEQEIVSIADDSIEIAIEKEEQQPSEGNTNTNTDADKNTNTDADKNTNTNTDKNTNTNKDDTKLPQTGIEEVSVIAIVALGIISIVSYVSYKKYKNI